MKCLKCGHEYHFAGGAHNCPQCGEVCTREVTPSGGLQAPDDLPRRSLNIGRCFQDSIEVYQKNFLILALAAAVAEILSGCTIFIIGGSIYAGLYMMILKSMRTRDKVDFNELFSYFSRFFTYFGILWLGLILVLVGFVLCVLPALLPATWLMFALLLAADRRFSLDKAFSGSYRLVNYYNFWAHLLLVVIMIAISLAAASVPYVGVLAGIVVAPFTFGLMVSAYRQAVDETEPEILEQILNS